MQSAECAHPPSMLWCKMGSTERRGLRPDDYDGSRDIGMGGYDGDGFNADRGLDDAIAAATAPGAAPILAEAPAISPALADAIAPIIADTEQVPVPDWSCEDEECLAMYQQCGGGNLKAVKCCEEGTVCTKKNPWCAAQPAAVIKTSL